MACIVICCAGKEFYAGARGTASFTANARTCAGPVGFWAHNFATTALDRYSIPLSRVAAGNDVERVAIFIETSTAPSGYRVARPPI